jgi:hypothetical protein
MNTHHRMGQFTATFYYWQISYWVTMNFSILNINLLSLTTLHLEVDIGF